MVRKIKVHVNLVQNYLCRVEVRRLTMAHNDPSDVATMVAARGWLYINASSPKLPLPSYLPTKLLLTMISYCPLKNGKIVSDILQILSHIHSGSIPRNALVVCKT